MHVISSYHLENGGQNIGMESQRGWLGGGGGGGSMSLACLGHRPKPVPVQNAPVSCGNDPWWSWFGLIWMEFAWHTYHNCTLLSTCALYLHCRIENGRVPGRLQCLVKSSREVSRPAPNRVAPHPPICIMDEVPTWHPGYLLASYPGPHVERGRWPGDTWQNSLIC